MSSSPIEHFGTMLRTAEVAYRCGVSAKTVKRWIQKDGLPVHRVPGVGSRGITLVSVTDLESWLASFRRLESDDEPTIQLAGRRLIK